MHSILAALGSRFRRHHVMLAAALRRPTILIAILFGILAPAILAFTYPVDYPGGTPRATATFVEDHGGWHAGVDIPRTNGARNVRSSTVENLHQAFTPGFQNVVSVLNENSIVRGPWQIEVTAGGAKYMLDVIRVRRVTTGKPVRTYTVQNVVESPAGSGFTNDRVNLVPFQPDSASALTGADSLAVDYAYYRDRLFQCVFRAPAGGEFYWYAHIDSVHALVSWNTYPATNGNRFYGPVSGIPAGRDTFRVNEGVEWARIEALLNFGTEHHHLHYSTTDNFTFPNSATNPFGNGRFTNNDPQGNRPQLRSIRFKRFSTNTFFPNNTLYGGSDIFAESRDDMGAPENNNDGDADNIRETGVYNAGYWVEADGSGGNNVASSAAPNMMFAGNGKNTITGADPLSVVLRRGAPFQIDINTNYGIWASHVQEDSTRYWNTRARSSSARNDGSDGPGARVNGEARFRDGKYRVKARARDATGFGAERESLVVVDNFRPYVRKVVVKDGTSEIYRAEWKFGGTQITLSPSDPDSGLLDSNGKKRCADGQNDVTIEVTFSEAMKEAAVSAIEPLGFAPILQRDPAGQDSIWKATVPKDKLETGGAKSGRQIISFTGKDWADNAIRAITTAAAIDTATNMRDAAGVMQGTGGTDRLHRFAVCQNVAFVIDDTGSMSEEIDGVKTAVINMIDANTADPNKFPRYFIITFKDDITFRGSSSDPDVVKPIINGLFASGGGDCPEASVEALNTLPDHMPRGGLAVFATDADPSAGVLSLLFTIFRLQFSRIPVNTLVTGSCSSSAPFALARSSDNQDPGTASGQRLSATALKALDERLPVHLAPLALPVSSYDAFSRVASETGGFYFQITRTDFDEALQVVIQQFDANAFIRVRQDSLASGTKSYTVPIDSSATAAFFTLNPKPPAALSLVVRRPDGAPLDTLDADVTLTEAATVKSYRVTSPAAGDWTVEVSGSGAFSFRGSADSPRSFLTLSGLHPLAGEPDTVTVQQLGDGVLGSFELVAPDGAPASSLSLYDDGAHGDGSAGDGLYGGSLPPLLEGSYRIAALGTTATETFSRESVQSIAVGAPDIDVAETVIDFGSVPLGASAIRTFTLANAGMATLFVDPPASSLPEFVPDAAPASLTAGQVVPVAVVFTPTSADSFSATLTIGSSDPDEDSLTVNLVGVGTAPPVLSAPDDSLKAAAVIGSTTPEIRTFVVHNNGASPLQFTVIEEPGATTEALSAPSVRREPSFSPLRFGGPDGGGYRFRDSQEIDGPAFLWQEPPPANSVGPLNDEDAAGPFPIGFAFSFYGESFTQFCISSNGFITLGPDLPGNSPYPDCFPSSYAPGNIVAPFWDNLDPSQGGRISWESDGERLVVEYRGVMSRDYTQQPNTFRLILHRGGAIQFRYGEIRTFPYADATFGIQNGDATAGLDVGCYESSYPHSGLAIDITPDCSWLAASPVGGTVAAGDSLTINASFSPNIVGLLPDRIYHCDLMLVSGDPLEPLMSIPAEFTVLPGPGEISGHVSAAATGNPVAGAVVSCSGPLGVYSATTDTAGYYAVSGIPNAGYTCSAVSSAYSPSGTQLVSLPPAATVDFSLIRPEVAALPDSLSLQMTPGDTTTLELQLDNPGDDSLSFSATSSLPEGLLAPDLVRDLVVASGAGQLVPAGEEPQLAKGDASRDGTGEDMRLAAGGPDAFGYKWEDSDSPDGPAFQWTDIAATGTAIVGLSDDINLGPFPIGFPFTFYGTTFTTFRFCSNGFLSFTSLSSSYSNGAIPSAASPENLLAPFWDDLDFSSGGSAYYQSDGNRLVVQYTGVPQYGGGGPYTFQVILNRSGTILFQYLQMGTPRISATVGIQNANGTIGLQVVRNATYVKNNLTVRFTPACPWLTVTPPSGVVPPGGSQKLYLHIDSSGFPPDTTLSCVVDLTSNAPLTPALSLPLTVKLGAVSGIGGSPTSPIREFALFQNRPNPFGGATRIGYALPVASRVTLRIFDASGRLVRTLVDATLPAGLHAADWNGRDGEGRLVPKGLYFSRMEAGRFSATRKILLR